MEEERKEIFTKESTFLEEFKGNEIRVSNDVTLDDLIKAFARFQEKKSAIKPLNTVITRKEYSVRVRSKEIMHKLNVKKQMEFEELFDIYTKDYVVVTFLSILDLAKSGSLVIRQNHNLDKIVLMAKDG